ncbi:GTPase HflX [Maricaulis sp. D1M11]|uniref:GTPase HflX n=1 Tax=Maricaulis sp. D1M11 TaxID=3076117 RepID=UPI0039B567B2
MIEREVPASRAIVIHPATREQAGRAEARLTEACGLAEALDLVLADSFILPMRKIEPGRFFGAGKVEDIKQQITESEATVAVLDTALTPVQQRNLERAWNVKVIDRTGLILEIFGQRARTKEGVLQVELARLAYERSRLVRTWTHLERQRGGRGFLAGPGETQIETDRRLLAEKMSKLRRQLDDVRRTRALHRSKRDAVPYPTIALVGYTNAGKSTLFNRLTGADVLAKDMPFATLDPTVRALRLPNGQPVLLSDTVGFITDLPTELIAAFRATLEEVREADLLVHVIDASDPDHEGRIKDVESVLDAIEAGRAHDQTQIDVWNKIDALDMEDDADFDTLAHIRSLTVHKPDHFSVSAVTGQGLETLLDALAEGLDGAVEMLAVDLPPQAARAHAWLHANGEVIDDTIDPDTGHFVGRFRLTPADMGRFRAEFPDYIDPLPVKAPYED